jgi:hypothetical protein
MPKVNGTTVRRGAPNTAREARALPVPALARGWIEQSPRHAVPGEGGLLDFKKNVGEAETYLASRGGADDPTQFVRAFQRLRIGFV